MPSIFQRGDQIEHVVVGKQGKREIGAGGVSGARADSSGLSSLQLRVHEFGVAGVLPFGGGEVAAVDDEGCAGNSGGIFATEIERRLGDIVW